MTTAFSIVLGVAAACYAALIGLFAVGFRRVRRAGTPGDPPRWPRVSVVVAARNEAAGIGACLRAILANDYPPDRFEVIVVDDFSEDETPALVRRLQARRPVLAVAGNAGEAEDAGPPLRLLRMHEVAGAAAGHKRHALHRGIEAASGEIILTTDADCAVPRRWIRTMAAHFTPETGFVAGPVRYRPGRTLFGKLQALEFLALVATGAGGIGLGRPNMCNGANVAYRRAVYERFGLPHDADAGPADDEALAQRLAAETAWQVRFCADPQAVVETDPMPDLPAFWAQRRRWAATGPRYPRAGLVAVVLGVYAYYVLLLAGLAALPLAPALWPAVALALALKIGAEATLLYPACRHFGQRRLFRYFVPEQGLQILYVVLIGVSARLGATHWKGRRIFR